MTINNPWPGSPVLPPLGARPRRKARLLPFLIGALVVAVVAMVAVGRHKHITLTLTFDPAHIRVGQTSTSVAYAAPADAQAAASNPVTSLQPADGSCQSEYKMIEVGQEVYKAEMGSWPTSLSALETPTRSPVTGAMMGPWIPSIPVNGHFTISVSGDTAIVHAAGSAVAVTDRSAAVACQYVKG